MINIKLMIRSIKFWFQRRTRGWSDDETWNLDVALIEWINSRFKKYKELAKIVDLEFYSYKYKKKTYTQLQIIDRIINITDDLLIDIENNEYFLNDNLKNINELFDLIRIIFFQMWW